MEKVLLINPMATPVSFSRQANEAYPQLGLGYIASYLRQNKIEVDLIDANALKIPYHKLKSVIEKSRAQVVGITAMTPNIYYALATAKLAKEVGCTVVMGGVHPTALYESLIKQPEVDFIVRGEGEITMLELARALDEKTSLERIDGLVFKDNGKIIVNKDRLIIQDLDSLPFPAWDLMPVDKYEIVVADKKPSVTMLISRGCPFRCVHCSSQIIFRRNLRQRSAINVADEMEMLIKEYKVKYIYFVDYCFTANKSRIMQLCQEIEKRRLKISWWAEGRADTVDEELLTAMRRAGCREFVFGVESGSQQILDNLQRGMSLEQIKKAIKIAKKVGFHVGANFMIGSPGDTRETVLETIRFAIELDANVTQFSIFTPYPGTEYYEIAKQKGLIKEELWQAYDNALNLANTYFPEKVTFKSENLSSEELIGLYKTAYRKFYLRPKYIFKNSLHYLSRPRQLWRTFLALVRLLKTIL